MLLVIKDNAVHAKFAVGQEDACQKAADAIEGSCELIKSVEDLMEYSGKDLATLYASMGAEDGEAVRAKLLKNSSHIAKLSIAKKVWEAAKGMKIAGEKVKKITSAVPKKPVSSHSSITPENHPRVNAIVTAMKAGGTKAEILSRAEMTFSGVSEPSSGIRTHALMVIPSLVLAGTVSENNGIFTWNGDK